MSKLLVTSDIHLTMRVNDEYRWSIFPFLARRAEHYKVAAIILAGDLTDFKDNHSAALVNRLIAELRKLSRVAPIHMIAGNHDYVDRSVPFFRFLSKLDGLHFYHKTTRAVVGDVQTLFVPHNPEVGMEISKHVDDKTELIILHHTFDGAINEQGKRLDGRDERPVTKYARHACWISGDVHVPQKLGSVFYCGAPHPIKFGDHFEPSVLLYDEGNLKQLRRTTIKKQKLTLRKINDLDKCDVTAGDQVRIVFKLPRADFVEWPRYSKSIRDAVKKRGLILAGLQLQALPEDDDTPTAPPAVVSERGTFLAFCKRRKIDKTLREYGERLLQCTSEN